MNKLIRLLLVSLTLLSLAVYAQEKAPAKAKDAVKTATKDAAKDASKLIDINSATAEQLEAALPGIGKVKSAAIVKARPYKRKDELVSKKVITENEYNKIKDLIIAKQATK